MGVIITSTTNAIKVDFNGNNFQEFVDHDQFSKGVWRIDHMSDIKLESNSDYVLVTEEDGHTWTVSYNTYDGALVVDTVDGVAPTSNSDLFDKLSALIE